MTSRPVVWRRVRIRQLARTREVGTLWIGGALSWMEQLCLKSFVEKGQKITLFSYEDIPNVPDGVICRNGREIIDTENFIKYEKKNSFALFADWFRLHMIQQNPGIIWVDTDVYCYRPMDYDSDYVLGYELPGGRRVNNAVLGLPADSEILRQMLKFTDDRYSIAAFLPKAMARTMHEAARGGEPIHVSQQPWGIWGPLMVTHYVHALGLEKHVLGYNAFYPVTFRERYKFMRSAKLADSLISEETTALHLWASTKRQLGNLHGGLPPKGSYYAKLVEEASIVPALAPIKGRGRSIYDGALIHDLDLTEVGVAADLTGNARSFMLAMHHKFDCDIQLFDINSRGRFKRKEQSWIVRYVRFLTDNGVAADRIKIIKSETQIEPVDVICNLEGFGDRFKIPFLEKFLKKMSRFDTRMFMDDREGSGTVPFLERFGTNEQLATNEVDGQMVRRVKVLLKPSELGGIRSVVPL